MLPKQKYGGGDVSAWSYLTKLSQLPHRGSASTAEAKAARLITHELNKLGLVVEHQYFRAPRKTLYHGPSTVILIYLAALFGLGIRHPCVAGLLMLLAAIPLVGELLGRPVNLNALPLPKYRSQNLIARLPDAVSASRVAGQTAAEVAATPPPAAESDIRKTPRPRVIITAHYDTQYCSWLFSPLFRPFIQPFFTSVYVVLALLPVGLIINALWPALPWVGEVMWLGSLYLALVVIGLLVGSISGGYINGANDNGSGTALAMALAQKAAVGELAALDISFVFTGSEETGTRGIMHFMSHFTSSMPEQTYFVNLDNLGAGIPRYLEGEGMLGYTPYHAELINLAKQVSKRMSGRVVAKHNLLLPTDGVIAARAGYPAITFIAMDEKGNIPHYHWFSDTLENIDRDLLQYMEDYLTAYLQALPEAVSAQASPTAAPAGG
jgi:hypothetical protein